jgi:RimJ/RimL family protein N-acetyltransferase
LVRPQYWGQGYAFEAASAVKRYAFDSLDLPKLVAFVRPGNDRSKHLAIKIGMQEAAQITNKRGLEMLMFELQR